MKKGIILFCLTVLLILPVTASRESNPYYDTSSLIDYPTNYWVRAVITVDGNYIPYGSALPFEVNNVVYLPLRATLNACGVTNSDIIWNHGTVSIRLGSSTIKIQNGSDCWYLNAQPKQISSGHVRAIDGITYVPKEMLDDWRVSLGSTQLDQLTISTGYCPHKPGYALIVYS